jgi:uncharacterized protein (UPF0216 family)
MPKKIEVKMEDPTILLVDGKKYRLKKEKGKIKDGRLHGDKATFEEFDEKKHKENMDFLVANIQKLVTKKEMIKEIIKHLPSEDIEKAVNLIRKGIPVTKTEGCITINIGMGRERATIPLL